MSACIRLNYTINLTDSSDYLFGIGDIVIWGYAENGIGMIVGCISTLRPLFRRVFNLGEASGEASGQKFDRTVWPSNNRSRHAYTEFEGFENGYELPEGTTMVKGGQSRSSLRSLKDDSSQEHILEGGIKVSRSILQDVSYNSKP